MEKISVFEGYFCLKLRGQRNSPGLRLRGQLGDAAGGNAGLRGDLATRAFWKFSATSDKFDLAIFFSRTRRSVGNINKIWDTTQGKVRTKNEASKSQAKLTRETSLRIKYGR